MMKKKKGQARERELEEIAELLSIGIAHERESFSFYQKAYGKCLTSCESPSVQKALSALLETKKHHEEELRKLLNTINLELMKIRAHTIEKSTVIKASPEDVFTFLTDRTKVPEWNELIKEARITSKEPIGVGSTVHYVGVAGGTQAEWDIETTEWIPSKKYAWRTTSGDVSMIVTWTLRKVEAGTELTYELRYVLPYSILGKILNKLKVSKDMKKGMAKALQNLKELLEKNST